jgi:hypothetical protein
VQQRGAQGRRVEPHAGADLGDADRVDDELLARLAALVGVVLARERERAQDGAAVDRLDDLVGVLGHDREQVREQLVLERRQVGGDLDAAVVRALGAVDGAVPGDGDRRVVGLGRAAGDDRRAGLGRRRGGARVLVAETLVSAVQAAASVVSLLVRYRRPSSSRRW